MGFELLGDLVKIKGGKRLPKGSSLQSLPNSHPYIRVKDMGSKQVPKNGIEYVPDYVFEKINRYILRENDLIISIVGTIGLVSIIDDFYHNASQSENCAKLSGLDKFDANYLYYYLISNVGQQEINSRVVGAVQLKLPLYNIEKINVAWPSKSIRRVIASILSNIDNKIQINNQINQNLEAMAQAIFKSWFVDFDPVHAKRNVLVDDGSLDNAERAAMRVISSKTDNELVIMNNEQPEAFSQLKQAASLFPSKFTDSELGEIPKGWEVGQLKDICNYTNERTSVEELTINNYISTESMLEDKQGITTAAKLPNVKTVPRVKESDILISNIRPYFKKIWFANFEGGRSADVLGFESISREQKEFVYNLLFQDTFFDFMMQTSKGVKMPRGDKTSIMNMEIVIPSPELMIFYSQKVEKFYPQINQLNDQNQTLAELQDALLPKLLSGELDVSGLVAGLK